MGACPAWPRLEASLKALHPPWAYGIGRNQVSLVLCTGIHVGVVLSCPSSASALGPAGGRLEVPPHGSTGVGPPAPKSHQATASPSSGRWALACFLLPAGARARVGRPWEPVLLLPPQGRGVSRCQRRSLGRAPLHLWMSDSPEPRLALLPGSHLARLSGQFLGTGGSVAWDTGISLLALG